MIELTLEHKKVWFLGLLFKCPAVSGNLDCKNDSINELSPGELEEKIFDMNEDELEKFIKKHKCCIGASDF